ncbi:MAG: hypothetical protein ABI824_17915 [Acidobacteriota bacterium]
MSNSYLSQRLDHLRDSQNPDGGWSYQKAPGAGKQSWLEPTVYAALALHGEPAADRAWALLKGWQNREGWWPASPNVKVQGWGTALCITLAQVRGESGDAVKKAVTWLTSSAGVDASWFRRATQKISAASDGPQDLRGWSWTPGTASSVEPSAHALVALKKAALVSPSPALTLRIQQGEEQLLDVQAEDSGWNYGSTSIVNGVLHGVVDVAPNSFPDTTGLALLALQGNTKLPAQLERAQQLFASTSSSRGRAWLSIALRIHGISVPAVPPADVLPNDLSLLALEALAGAEGNYAFFQTQGATVPAAKNLGAKV